jgi:RHS repeat-associated protein
VSVGQDDCRLDIVYGPDRQRWKSTLKKNNVAVKTTIFAGDYEEITEGGATKYLYYISDDNGLAAVYVKQSGQSDKIYYACTDHLGSIIKLVDGNGAKVFEATYDAWGKQTVSNSSFKFYRGYTGHEHLPEFNLIDMNGRMYDPLLGRFLSPDPFVQSPEFSQSFNRYSYCLNNPLRYTDPDGELLWLAMLLFTDVGYSIQKAISPVAVHIDLRLGNHQGGIGIEASVGISQMFPISYRVHGGATYYWKNEDLMGNNMSGWETRYGSEWGIIYVWNTGYLYVWRNNI